MFRSVFEERVIQHTGVAHRNAASGGFGRGRRADVDEIILGLDGLVFRVIRQNVGRRHADYAVIESAAPAAQLDAVGGKDAVVPAAELGKLDEAAVVNVADHHADFVGMGVQQQPLFSAALA